MLIEGNRTHRVNTKIDATDDTNSRTDAAEKAHRFISDPKAISKYPSVANRRKLLKK